MYSIAFPDMFGTVKTNLVTNHQATSQNLQLLLKSDRGSLFGDPYFGTILKQLIFNPNNIVLQDLVVDEIYTCIQTFMPQLKLTRNDIHLYSNKVDLFVNIQATNILDYQTNLFNIKLTNDSET